MLGEVVVRVHVSLMMFAVVKFHDLAGDGGLESAIVICRAVRWRIESLRGDLMVVKYMVDLGE